MRVTHQFSNTIGDATGTVTVPNLSGGTSSVAATQVPRPTNWNEPHALSFILAGNTTNASTVSGTEVQFRGAGYAYVGGSASSLIISVAPPLATAYNEFKESPLVAGQVGQGSVHIQRWNMPDIAFDRVVMPVIGSATTGQSGTATVSFNIGIYTLTGSSLSLLASTSGSTSVSYQGTGNNSQLTGVRLVSFPWTTTITGLPGAFIAILSRTTTGGGAATLSQFLASQINSGVNGFLGSTLTAGSVQLSLGHGVWTTTTTALPNSFAIADIRETASAQMRPPSILFQNGTA